MYARKNENERKKFELKLTDLTDKDTRKIKRFFPKIMKKISSVK